MIDIEYAEYRCTACKKEIKSLVVQCRACTKLFFYPGCVSKHKVYNRANELVKYAGPFEEFSTGNDKLEIHKKTPTAAESGRDRLGSTGSAGSASNTSNKSESANKSANKSSDMDVKIDWLMRAIKEMRDEMACKKEIKTVIKEIVRKELEGIKLEFEELRRSMQVENKGPPEDALKRSYCEAVRSKEKESVIIVKPKKQQESEATKKLVMDSVDIKNLGVGITRLRKGNNGTVIVGCDNEGELKKLKTTVQNKMGEEYKIMEPKKIEPKIKIINVGKEEMELKEVNLIEAIKKQNKIDEIREGFYIRVVKRIVKEGRNDNMHVSGKEEGSLILEVDDVTHELMLKREKINIGWRKCRVFNYFSVKRCYKCWGYYHIAKYCTRQDTCHRCAGNHKANECTISKKRCVNCMYKVKTYNLKINDEHDALSMECPTFKRALEEEKRRTGWGATK
ncbi:uncharacterized protein [Temnothorax longispinosus]|uniref:uncharacterized protein n=1 Tax=Temnothorax longispinosus TaxID=300112 RepID=UPI003A9A05D5